MIIYSCEYHEAKNNPLIGCLDITNIQLFRNKDCRH